MSADSDDVIGDNRVVLCLGSGGVGKTTLAAALAVALARRGERVVVLTVDPARRLADTLGDELDNDPKLVAFSTGDGPPIRLWATMLDPAETFESVVRSEARSQDQATRILSNPLFRNLTRSLSGTAEYMATERLHQLHGDDRFDRVVVDTPPSRHALDFLDSPGRLNRFINHRLYRSVFAPRGLMRTISIGSRFMLGLLGRLVGSRLVDDVISFFAAFEGLDEGFQQRAVEIGRVLETETARLLITSPRRQPLAEAVWIASGITDRLGPDAVDAVIINRACPVAPTGTQQDQAGAGGPEGEEHDPLAVNRLELGRLARLEAELTADVLGSLTGDPPIVRIDERPRPVADQDALIDLARDLTAALGLNAP